MILLFYYCCFVSVDRFIPNGILNINSEVLINIYHNVGKSDKLRFNMKNSTVTLLRTWEVLTKVSISNPKGKKSQQFYLIS